MPEAPSERRQATILFAGLCETLTGGKIKDTNQLRDALDALFKRWRAAVEAHGGTVDKFIGDTMMAVFGAPVAHGDDALRAVRASLALRRELGAFNAERGIAWTFSAGLNHGEILWGVVAGDRPTAMGDPVNVAERLRRAAAAGSVLVTSSVERIASRGVGFRALEPLELKGRAEPVPVFEALEERDAGTVSRIPSQRAPFVGREAELAGLAPRVAKGGLCLWIEGEAGVGKSRLAAELRREFRTRARGAWVATGRALEGVKLPLAAFAEIVSAECGVQPADAGGVGRLVKAIGSDILELTGAAPIDAENSSHLIAMSLGCSVPDSRVRHIEPERMAPEMHLAWSRWIDARAGGPGLLCVEDVQWADEGTLDLLAALASRFARRPFSIVVTARPGVPMPAGFERLALRDLDASATSRMGEAAFRAPLAPELAAFLSEKTGGNPYYVEELSRFLHDEGLAGGSPATLRVAPERVPVGLQSLLVARLDRLAPADKETLKTASVVGRVFWSGILDGLLGRDSVPSLDECRRLNLVSGEPDSLLPDDLQLAFRHALLKDAAYSLLTRKDRARLHDAAAGLLEKRAPAAGRRVKALAAAQRSAAGRADEAARLWLEAAEEALSESAFGEALAWGTEAAALQKSGRASLLLCRVHRRLGKLREALADADAAVASGDAEAASGARLEIARAQLQVGSGEAALAPVGALLEASPSTDVRIQALGVRSIALGMIGRTEEALRSLEEAKAVPDGSFQSRTELIDAESRLHYLMGRVDLALETARRGLELRKKAANPYSMAISLNNVGTMLLTLHRTAESCEPLEEALRIRREIGDRHGIASTLSNLASAHNMAGDTPTALKLHEEALAMRREIGDRGGIAASLGNIGNVYYMTGEDERALQAMKESMALRAELGDRFGEALCLGNIAIALSRLRRLAEAREALDRSLAIRRTINDRGGIALALHFLADIELQEGRHAEAERLALEAASMRRELKDHRAHLTSRGLAAFAMAAAGDFERATREFAASVADARALGDPTALADRLGGYSTVLADQGRFKEAAAAREEALRLRRAAGEHRQEPWDLYHLARLTHLGGEKEEARRLVHDALELARSLEFEACEGALLATLARILAESGDPCAAKTLDETRARSIEWVSDADEVLFLEDCAEAAAKLGRTDDATAWAKRAFTLARRRASTGAAGRLRALLVRLGAPPTPDGAPA